MRGHMIGFAIAAVLLGACTLDFDAAGPFGGAGQGGAAPDAGAPASGGAPEGGSPPVCNGTCVDLGSFVGPFSLDDAGCQLPVKGGYADAEPPFTAALATCGCACELPTPLGCSPAALTFYDETSCDGMSKGPFDIDEGDCFNLEKNGVTGYSFNRPTSGGPAGGLCVSNEQPAEIPDVQMTLPFEACALDESSCGGSNVCVPEDATGLCVLASENEPCPEQFPQRREVLLESELLDDRDCQCICGAFSGTCTPAFELYSDGACWAPEASQLASSCIGSVDGGPIGGLIYQPIATGATCATAGPPTGGVTAGPINFLCCAGE